MRFLKQILTLCRPLYGAVALSFPLIVLNRLGSLVIPASTKILVDDVILQQRGHLLWLFLAVTAGAALMQSASSFALARLMGRAHERLVATLRTRLQGHLLSLPLAFHESAKTGALVSTIIIDVEGFPKLLTVGVVEATGAILGAVFALVLLLRIDAWLAGGALVLVIIQTALSQYATRKATGRFREHQRTKADVMARLHETLTGIRLVKAYDAERYENTVFGQGALRIFERYMAAVTAVEILRATSMAVLGVGTAALLYTGASRVLAGDLSLGGLMTFSATIVLLLAPIHQLVGLASQLPQALAEVERTVALLDERTESHSGDRSRTMPPIRGRVSFDRVTFGYVPGRPVLRDVSFEVGPGTAMAVVGPSGVGKSTLAALIASLYTPNEGTIRVDGQDLSAVSFASYRSQVGMVLQDTFLFDGTILENVAFSRVDTPEAAIIAACKAAHVDEFAERLPDGYHTIIGERGVKLSGGQRQRIAIARALLVNPRILILDEPTSSLDARSEDIVITALKRLIAGRTTFVISHRPSLLRTADRVMVLEDGRIDMCSRDEGLSVLGLPIPLHHAGAGGPSTVHVETFRMRHDS